MKPSDKIIGEVVEAIAREATPEQIILFPIDILLYSKTEVERWKHSLNNVVAHAFREGKVVYERH